MTPSCMARVLSAVEQAVLARHHDDLPHEVIGETCLKVT